MKKIILYGAGAFGLNALSVYRERVAFFCDYRAKSLQQVAGIPVIEFDKLKEIWPEFDVIVTPSEVRARKAIAQKLQENGIAFSIFVDMGSLYHLYGNFPDIDFEYEHPSRHSRCISSTSSLFKSMLREFYDDFSGKMLDVWFYCVGDYPLLAYNTVEHLGLRCIFCYATMYPIQKRVIPIPDYLSYIPGGVLPAGMSVEDCKQAASKTWQDARAYWRGSLVSNRDRSLLDILGQQYPEYLKIEDSMDAAYVPMCSQASYKYLIDIRGYGWTDRVKVLLQLGRPLLLVDRPYKEWYFDQLVPMKHYVPVKEDLSDLIDRIQYMEEHPQLYDEIVKNALEFSEKVLNAKVLEYLRDVTLKYGVVDKLDERKWPWNPEMHRKGKLLE